MAGNVASTAGVSATSAGVGADASRVAEATAACVACGRVTVATAPFCRHCGVGRDRTPWQVAPRGTLPSLESRLSSAHILDAPQARWAAAVGLVVLGGLLISPVATVIALLTMATVLYVAAVGFRLWIFRRALSAPPVIEIDAPAARAIPDDELPIYTVLIPAYREPEVIGGLLASIDALDYPIERLDVKLLLELDDAETFQAVIAARPGRHVEIIRVPPSEPRTKPKACNVGLAAARGEYVTIFDAEDRPDPLQLRRAVAAFRTTAPTVACLQAKLSYHNPDQNLITRWFTAEYATWFGQFLPGLASLGVPVPLGGTSNHFRRPILEALGAWDPHNVTEDADLGIRLHRAGYRTAVLGSTTLEEANSDFVNWMKQRSRWYKGYIQTWLVHMRDPRRLWRELGAGGFAGLNLFVGGTPLLALLNPVFWALTALWFLARPAFVEAIFPAWLYYASLLCLVGGNFLFLYTSMVSARALRRPGLVFAAALVPFYWLMMSIAAIKAVVQLVSAPSFWEKTAHGLDVRPSAEPAQ